MSVLYEECLMALSDNVTVMGFNKSKIHADEFFEMQSVTNAKGEPELQFMAYNEQNKVNYFCRL